MAEPTRMPFWSSDEALERALVDLAAHVDFPPTPNLASSVVATLAARPARSAPASWLRWSWRPLVVRRSLVLALALTLLLVGAAIGLRLGLQGLQIVPVSSLPPVPSASMPPGPDSESRLGLGELTTLQAAQSAVPFTILLPRAPELTTPDAVYLGHPPASGRVELVYRVRAGLPSAGPSGIGLLVTQFRGHTGRDYINKMIGGGTAIELVTVDGATGYWISGQPHVLFYESDGGVQNAPGRLVGDALIWERDGVIYRIESSLPRENVLAIAASLR